jgi:sugar phosphate permease
MNLEKNSPSPSPIGLKPWIIWGAAALFFFYEYLQRVAPSVMVPDLMRAFRIEGTAVGELGAFYYYAYAVLQIPVGILADRYGPKRPLVMAALLCAGGSLLFASAQGLGSAQLGRLLIGAGSGFAFVCCLRLATNWFPESHFGLLVGLTNMLGMVGAISGEAPLAAMVHRFAWRGTFYFLAALAIVLAALILVVVRDHPGPKTRIQGFQEGSWPRLFSDLKAVLKNPHSWFNGIYAGCINAPLAAFGALWGVSFMSEVYGLRAEAAAASISILFVGCMLGSVFYGWISDQLGKRKPPMIMSGIFSLAIMLAILYSGDIPLFLANTLLFALGFMGQGPVIAYAAGREVNPPAAAGIASGLINTLLIGMGAASQALVGWLLDIHWTGTMKGNEPIYTAGDFRFAMNILIVLLAMGIVSSFLIRETHCRQRAAPGP